MARCPGNRQNRSSRACPAKRVVEVPDRATVAFANQVEPPVEISNIPSESVQIDSVGRGLFQCDGPVWNSSSEFSV